MQLGPQYDMAVRLKTLEDRLARLENGQYGQAFSSTQSDGSVGMQIYQDTGTGGSALVFRQGPTSPRDPDTNQHATLLYVGQLFVGSTPVDSGVIFYRPDGTESAVAGNRGVQLFDAKGNQVLATDEYGTGPSGEGLTRPWLAIGPLASTRYSQWVTSSTSGTAAECFFIGQLPKVYWNMSIAGDSGVSGSVQLTLASGSASVSSSSVSTSGGAQNNHNEVLTLPQPFFNQEWSATLTTTITGGTGNLYVQTWALEARGS